MARPPKEINWEVVLLRMQARNKATEIAQAFNIDINNFYDRFKKEFGCGFADYAAREKEHGVSNIAYMQYTKALKGSEKMLTLLGKEWLGQGSEIVHRDSPVQEVLDSDHLRMENQYLKSVNNALRASQNEPEAESELL